MKRRDDDRLAEAQAREFGDGVLLSLHVFGLVGGEDDRLSRRTQLIRDLVVGGRQTCRRIHDPHDHVCFGHSLFGLQPNVGQQIAFARIQADPAGIDDGELPVAPLGRAVQPIAGCAGDLVNHGAVFADQPVEQRGFADVGSTDQRHNRHGLA